MLSVNLDCKTLHPDSFVYDQSACFDVRDGAGAHLSGMIWLGGTPAEIRAFGEQVIAAAARMQLKRDFVGAPPEAAEPPAPAAEPEPIAEPLPFEPDVPF